MKELPETELIFDRESPEPTAVLVDFMSKVRHLPLCKLSNGETFWEQRFAKVGTMRKFDRTL